MGLEQRREKIEKRAVAVAGPYLEPEERIEGSLFAIRRLRLLLYMLPLFPVLFVLGFTDRGSIGPWVVGAYTGILTVVFMRHYVVVSTNRRLLLLRLRRLSGKKVEETISLDPTAVGAGLDRGIISWTLTLSTSETKYELQVSGTSQAAAARGIVDRLDHQGPSL